MTFEGWLVLHDDGERRCLAIDLTGAGREDVQRRSVPFELERTTKYPFPKTDEIRPLTQENCSFSLTLA